MGQLCWFRRSVANLDADVLRHAILDGPSVGGAKTLGDLNRSAAEATLTPAQVTGLQFQIREIAEWEGTDKLPAEAQQFGSYFVKQATGAQSDVARLSSATRSNDALKLLASNFNWESFPGFDGYSKTSQASPECSLP